MACGTWSPRRTTSSGSAVGQCSCSKWRPRQAWLDLSRERRNAFLSGMGADLEAFTAAGITPVAMGETELLLEGTPWTFWAVWQAPHADAVRTFGGADDPHLISYFEQVRITGSATEPASLARAMADLPGPAHAD